MKRQPSGALLEGITTTDGVLKAASYKELHTTSTAIYRTLRTPSEKAMVWILDCSLYSHRLARATGTTKRTDSSNTHHIHFTMRFSKINNKMTNFNINGRHDISYRF